MKKFLVTLFSVLVSSIVVMCAACKHPKDDDETKKPEKIKDGIALTITEGESQNIDLSEYISIEGTEFAYTVYSSDDSIATATVDGNTATVTAVSKGNATVTANADEISINFAVTVNEKQQPEEKPAPEFKDVNIEYDLVNVNSKSVTLSPKTGSNTFIYTFSLKEEDDKVTIEGNKLTVSYGEPVEKQLTLVASYTDSETPSAAAKTVEFKLNIKVTDTREEPDLNAQYKVVNGNFDNGLEGWTMEGEIGEITEQSTFWEQNFPIFNVGKYFSGANKEGGKGTLASSEFVVGGINKISFMLGAAGNKDCYITLEKADGTVLAIWRNTKFEDVGEWNSEEIGKTQFACNLVTYVADLSAYEGETLKIVLHDNAESVFGFFNFDELVTYYADENGLPANAYTAENQLADKTALKTAVDNALTEQGDYTEESFNAYTAKVEAAKAILDDVYATQADADSAKTAIESAFANLTLRTPEEVGGAVKNILVLTGFSKNLTISDYIDSKNLSEITYEITSDNALITVGEIENGKFTVTAGETEVDVDVNVVITVKYKGESKLTVTLTMQVKCELQPTVKQPQLTHFVDIYTCENKDELTIDFTENIESNGIENLVYAVTSKGEAVTLDADNRLVYKLDGDYDETAIETVFDVVIGYGNNKSVGYTYTLKICDTTVYRAVNGNFDSGLEGWTMEGEIGEITEQSTFWEQNFPIFNVGKYFSGVSKEGGKGTLASSEFVVGGINKISFMLGAAGNKDCYITLEKADGTVLAIWRNTKFEDVGNWQMEEIGKTQFACNLVTYVADLSAYEGETLKIVLHDNAESVFGFFNFDELVTYYADEAELPANAYTAENQIADKTALKAAVDNALTEQGDYTEESFNAYTAKVEAAKAILDDVYATQTEVDNAKTAIESAFAELKVRIPEEKADAEKSFRLLAGNSKELTIADYVDDKNLSNLTYEIATENEEITLSEIAEGKFTVTAGSEEVTGAKVSIVVKYNGEIVLTVEIAVTVTTETAPALKEGAVEKSIDLFTENNKENIVIDFASNVENVGGLELNYSVTMDGESITLDVTSYNYYYESYTDTATEVVFAVTVSFSHNGEDKSLSYNYTLKIKDTRAYRITNGGFDNGLDGWILSNPDLGGVNSNETYWNENIPFNNDGNFFNAYNFNGNAKESAMGTLTSSAFKIGGSGWITYKLGGAKNADKVFIDVIEKETGNILARYYNNAFSDDSSQTDVRGCTLLAYKADLSQFIGKTVYIRLVDNDVNDYGLFFVDSFVTYYPEAPESELTVAELVTERPATIYDILNGGFEKDMTGWTVSGGDIGAVTSDKGYWNNGNPDNTANEYGKEGEKLFSWWSWNSGAEINREGNIGTLTSNMFVLKSGKYVSFKFGGGGNRNVFMELVNAENGSIIAIFRNDNIEGGKLKSYSYQLDGLTKDTLCYFRVVDNAIKVWGCFTADDFRVNLDSAPEGSANAVNHINEYLSVENGSFETGNLDGWTKIGEIGEVVENEIPEDWYQTNETTKDGKYLFTFHYNNGSENVNVEGNTGIVRSSAFILRKNGIISFRFGAAHNSEVYIKVYATGGRCLATFRNNAYTQDTVMVHYYYQFDNTEELSCYFEVVDNATKDYGCIVMDDFRANLDSVPEGAVLGSDKIK